MQSITALPISIWRGVNDLFIKPAAGKTAGLAASLFEKIGLRAVGGLAKSYPIITTCCLFAPLIAIAVKYFSNHPSSGGEDSASHPSPSSVEKKDGTLSRDEDDKWGRTDLLDQYDAPPREADAPEDPQSNYLSLPRGIRGVNALQEPLNPRDLINLSPNHAQSHPYYLTLDNGTICYRAGHLINNQGQLIKADSTPLEEADFDLVEQKLASPWRIPGQDWDLFILTREEAQRQGYETTEEGFILRKVGHLVDAGYPVNKNHESTDWVGNLVNTDFEQIDENGEYLLREGDIIMGVSKEAADEYLLNPDRGIPLGAPFRTTITFTTNPPEIAIEIYQLTKEEIIHYPHLFYNRNGLIFQRIGHLIDSSQNFITQDSQVKLGPPLKALTQILEKNVFVLRREEASKQKYPISPDGFLVKEVGHLVNEESRLVNSEGRLVDWKGNWVNSDFQRIDSERQPLKMSTGQPLMGIERDGKPMNST